MAFFAVIREALETVVFPLAVLQSADDRRSVASAPPRTGAGDRGGVKLDLLRCLRLTGLVLVLVAAGLVASSLHEAGWILTGQAQALDLTWLVAPGTWTSALLTGMLGGQPQPPRPS